MRRTKIAAAIVGNALMIWCTQARADVLPPPPQCNASLVGAVCDGRSTTPSAEFEGICMESVEGEFYCRVGDECFPAEPPNVWEIVAEPCPEEADVEDDGEDGCTIRQSRSAPVSVGLVSTGTLALLAFSLRRRKRR